MEVDKSAWHNWVHEDGSVLKEKVREKGVGKDWGKLGGLELGEGGRMDMGAGKYISQLREPF